MVTNTVKEPLLGFQDRYGGRLDYDPNTKHPNWQPLYRWYIFATGVRPFLEDLLPYLYVKKRPAEIAIEYRKIQEEFDKIRVRGKALPNEQIAIRNTLRLELKSFNSRKGPQKEGKVSAFI